MKRPFGFDRPSLPEVVGLVVLAGALVVPSAVHALPTPSPVGAYGAGILAQPTGIAISEEGDVYVASSLTRRVEKFTRHGTHVLGWGSLGNGPGQFQFPCGMAVNVNGSVYVADVNANRVQRFSTSGVFLSEFGAPGSGDGQFADPRGIAIGWGGDVYVADSYNNRVQRFSGSGVYETQWGGPGAGAGQFSIPQGIAANPKGDVYVADTYNHRIQKFDKDGTFVRAWGTLGTGDGEFTFPIGIWVDEGDNVYVTDANNHRVQRFTPTGVFVAKWGVQGSGTGEFVFPQAVAVDPKGDVHVADTNNHRVAVYRGRDGSGHEALVTWGGPGSGNGEFSDVRGVAIAPDDFVFVADKNGNRIQKFTQFGAWAAGWGTSGSGDGQLSGPTGLAVDASGIVYVADHLNARVQKFTDAGAFVGKWGTPGTGPGEFTGIWDLAIDRADPAQHVYVVDGGRVQKFTSAGAFVTQWSVSNATGVGIDAEGFVYVACALDHMVRKYSSTGTFIREWGGFGSGAGQFDHPGDVVGDAAGYVYVCDANDRIQQFTPLGGYIVEWGEPGSARRQLGAPQMMAVDSWGSLYVSEFLNFRVQKFASPPELVYIRDFPDDEGGNSFVHWTPTSAEAPLSGGQPTEYRIVRRQGNINVIVAVIPVDGVSFHTTAYTDGHTTDTWTGLNEFTVQAIIPVPGAHGVTGTNYGFSSDNLAPPTPSPFTGVYEPVATSLHWGESLAADFSQYRLYRGTSSAFVAEPGALIHASTDTGYVDPGPAGRHYKVAAADTSGNVSPPAILGPEETVDVPGGPGTLAFRLEPILPNPAHGKALVLRFALPDAAPARLDVVNVAGRIVWSSEVGGAGTHVLRAGEDRVLSPGVYLVRLVHRGGTLVRRAVVLD